MIVNDFVQYPAYTVGRAGIIYRQGNKSCPYGAFLAGNYRGRSSG